MHKNPDIWILLSVLGLNVFGVFSLIGIDRALAFDQFIFFIVGIIASIICFKIGLSFFHLNERVIYLTFIFLLIVTYIFGSDIRGSRRWIDLYFLQFQTSEFFKPFFLVSISHYLSRHRLDTTAEWIKLLALFFIPFIIVFKQPDLGSSLIYLGIFTGLVFVIGFPIKRFFYIIAGFGVSTPVLWHFLKDYQKARIVSFINPELDSQGIAFNLIQAVITVGSGGFFGRGLGLGTQSRFMFLPENHTDFAYASLVEQFGLIGGALVIVLYCAIIYRLLRRAFSVRDNLFHYFFLLGTVLYFAIPLIINVGMNMGLLPVAGIALPFISYGGSSIVTTGIVVGMALSVRRT